MKICLLGLPRSGSQYISTMISESIESCTNIAEPFTGNHYYSIFEKDKNIHITDDYQKFDSFKDQVDYVLRTLKEGSLDQHLVMKVFLTEEIFPFLKEILNELKKLNFKFLIIKRENIEHHIISWLVACTSNKWNIKDGAHTGPINVDVTRANWLCSNITTFDELIVEYNMDVRTIRYEHAVLDLTKCLNISIRQDVVMQKQIVGDPYNMVENRDEVRKYLEKFLMTKKYIKLVHSNPIHEDWFVVNWCLGNTCNFKCSYCPSALHDGSKKWPDPQVIKNFIAKVKDHYFHKNIYFEFTGGEVTMYKHFTEICQFCNELGIKVGLISNGSRTIRYWEENKQFFDHVCLSYHPEFADEKHFVEVIKLLHTDVRTHVNIMMSPEKFDHCYAVANKVKNLGNISMALQPLIHDFGDTLYDYNNFQKKIFDKQHELITKHIKFDRTFDYYRGAMKTIDEDGTERISSAHRFISEKTNDWSGWKCYAGIEQLIVDMDGTIHRGWCKVGGVIGNINDTKLQLPMDPVVCNKTMCHCNFDIMCTKEK